MATKGPGDHGTRTDSYASSRPRFAEAVNSYAPRPKLGAGGQHNRPAHGHETET